ncbi:iron chelate uptake ABC transporter family permease subunit [Quadrisphaera granulorum]|uniref:iron chelate uptake ABC transporter family permease subunit n=1 Tax=Quadrisphaera granulorum TaxID=317664 RepID=UPI000D6B0BDA
MEVRPPRARRLRSTLWGVALAAVLAVVVAASLGVGARVIPPREVLGALFAPAGTDADVLVREARVPRTLVGVIAGGALGLAGALVQGHTRNPLADPGILGVGAGAAFAVCLGISAFGITSLERQVWLALLGALLVSAVVFAVGAPRGRQPAPVVLALVGTVVTALLTALTSAVLLLDSATITSFRFWTVGSLAGRGLDEAAVVLPFLLAGTVLAAGAARPLDAMALGEELAASLGNRLALARGLGVAAVALLTASAVAVAGPLVFVGLVAPHVARGITGPGHRRVLPLAAVVGVVTVLAADVVGRLVVHPEEVQVGIITALVGGPLFIAFVRRRRLASL